MFCGLLTVGADEALSSSDHTSADRCSIRHHLVGDVTCKHNGDKKAPLDSVIQSIHIQHMSGFLGITAIVCPHEKNVKCLPPTDMETVSVKVQLRDLIPNSS